MQNRNILKRQLTAQFYRGNVPAFCLAAAASLLAGTLNLILSWLMQQLIDAASGLPGALPLAKLARMTGGFVLLYVAVSLLRRTSEPRFLARAVRQYREFAFRKLTEKSISAFRMQPSAAWLSALTNDTGSVEENYLAQQLSVLTKTVTFFGSLGLMLWYSPLLTALAAVVTALPLAAALLTGTQLQTAERRVSDRSRDFTAALSDCLGGFAVVKTFQAENEIFRLFADNNRALEGEKFSRRQIKAMVGMIGSVAGVVAQLGVFLAGAFLAQTQRGLTAGAVILFVNLMNFIIEPIAGLPALLAGRRAALGLVEKLAEMLEAQPETAQGDAALPALTRGIRLEHVSFSYDGKQDALQDISTSLEAGRAYAVVGASGSGKSTLLNLLMTPGGTYRGQIFLDDAELRDISSDALYSLLSVIQQNVFVFNASIADNITLFRSFPPAALEDAIARAHLGGLLAERGTDAVCGENGCALSGGEKQRISIARSLLKNASLLLADEATAALDAQTSAQVTGDLLDLAGVTRIVVTHRLSESLLRRFDGILVLKNGRLAESGDFETLMAQRGYFHALFTVSQ